MSEPIHCAACATPVAAIRGGVLEIVVKHHKERHVTRLTLVDLEKLLATSAAECVIITR